MADGDQPQASPLDHHDLRIAPDESPAEAIAEGKSPEEIQAVTQQEARKNILVNKPHPDISPAEQRVATYLKNTETQAQGENEYWDSLWKTDPEAVWKTDPIKAVRYAAHDAVTKATNTASDAANAAMLVVDPDDSSFVRNAEKRLLGKNPGEDVANLAGVPKPEESPVKVGAITPEPEGTILPDDEYVYHATDVSRAPSIEKNGLKPNSWYAKTPQDALRSGATPISGNRADLRVYAVPKSEIEPTTPDTADIGAREVEKGRFIQSAKQHMPSHEVSPEGKVIHALRPKPTNPVSDFIARSMKRAIQEATGQGILDDMEEKGISPRKVSDKFWNETYFKLSPEAQDKFQKYLKAETSFQPGDVIGIDANKKPIIAKDWADLAENVLDIGDNPEHLEGTSRGLVALMKWANDGAEVHSGVQFSKDSNGITWATDKSLSPNPVSIPDEKIGDQAYAREKLTQQGQMAATLKARLHTENPDLRIAPEEQVQKPQ